MKALSGVWAANALLQGWANLDGERKDLQEKPKEGFEALLQEKEREIDENGHILAAVLGPQGSRTR
jgi:hypothetical protein